MQQIMMNDWTTEMEYKQGQAGIPTYPSGSPCNCPIMHELASTKTTQCTCSCRQCFATSPPPPPPPSSPQPEYNDYDPGLCEFQSGQHYGPQQPAPRYNTQPRYNQRCPNRGRCNSRSGYNSPPPRFVQTSQSTIYHPNPPAATTNRLPGVSNGSSIVFPPAPPWSTHQLQFAHHQMPHQQISHQQIPHQQIQHQQISHHQVPNQQIPQHQQIPHHQVPNQQIPQHQQIPHHQVPNQQIPHQQIPNQQIPRQPAQISPPQPPPSIERQPSHQQQTQYWGGEACPVSNSCPKESRANGLGCVPVYPPCGHPTPGSPSSYLSTNRDASVLQPVYPTAEEFSVFYSNQCNKH